MPDPTTSADLLLRLYDLRREAKMREARDRVIGAFHETSGRPDFLENTEKVVDDWPGARERMERTRERLRERAAGEGSPEE